MRATCIVFAVVLAASPAFGLELMELKSGKAIPVEEASFEDGKIRVRIAAAGDQYIATTYPADSVLPEFVFYVRERQLPDSDRAARLELAEWAGRNGLFRQALRMYEVMAATDEATRAELPAIAARLAEEEATWLYERAEALFKEGKVRDARAAAEAVLERFAKSKETGRAIELLAMIEEREQFLSAERRKQEAEARTRKQRILVRTEAAAIGQADAYARAARLRWMAESRWRLRWAGYLYERAGERLMLLHPTIDDERLRAEVEGHLDALPGRITATYLRLGDLRYLSGDLAGALDAAYRVLDVEPGNAVALALRDRILEGPGPTHVRYDRGFLTYRRSRPDTDWDWPRR